MSKSFFFGLISFLWIALTSCSSVQRRHETRDQQRPRPTSGRPQNSGITPVPSTRPSTPVPGATSAPSLPPTANGGKILELEKSGRWLEALKELVSSSAQTANKSDQEDLRARAIENIETRLKEEELHTVSQNSDYGFARAYALYRLGEISIDRQELDSARRYFSSVIEFLPGSDVAFRSQEIIDQLEASRRVSPKTIGVVLPLSGKNANIGQRALRGIQMGLGLHQPYSNFKLAIMDSEGNADSARRGVERLIREDNVIALVGSLLGKTALSEINKASEFQIPTLTLSQKSGLTELGPQVFRNSLTMEMQIRHLVQVAMEVQGLKKFAILYPNDPYGIETTNIFWDEVQARGGQIVGAQTYNPKDTDFRQPVQRLVGTFYIEARLDEYKFHQKAFYENNKNKSSRLNFNADDLLPPVVDFDGIFIPDSAKTMGQLAAFLSFAGVKNVKLLGTNLWNTPGLAKRAGNFADQLLFVDSFTPSSLSRNRFVSEYKGIYNEEPSLIEIQAYDSALILRHLIMQGADSREELSDKLKSLKQFPGSLGPLQMTADREIRRPLMALTLDKSGEVVPLKRK